VLPTSPTVDSGAVDAESGVLDLDGEPRVTGSAADIGADEQPPAATTATTLTCQPAAVTLGQSTSCTASVEKTSPHPDPPGGAVRFASNQLGNFSGAGACTLSSTGGGKPTCQLTYTPTATGPGEHEITAFYLGDASHQPSSAKAVFRLRVSVGTIVDPPWAPNTTIGRKPRRKSVSRLARFTFVADQAGSTFRCKLDGNPFKPCRSPFSMRVARGRHAFRVRAVSQAGTSDPTPAVFRWKVS
jgi:Bacterial Ig-like domain (group 3)